MARNGFAPIGKPDASAAETISKEDVGGVINQNAACIGISETKWRETNYEDALIPSSQGDRLTIAQVLLWFDNLKE
jgi:hypothetical protein